MSGTGQGPTPPSAKEIFLELCELPREQRGDALAARCGEDETLRVAVEALLDAHDRAGSFLAGPTLGEAGVPPHGSAQPLGQIGRYKLLQIIGEGGFGTVYLAEQEQPIRRRVALKLIRPGMDSRQVIARFEAERQALAMMDHPSIARVFDAGTSEQGRPFFVMELVEGVPITKYCDEHRLTARQRLELFVPVCRAVQHAHQKGIIHRDLKPSNVLVTLQDGSAVPKVIDFGIAKATEARLTEKTVFTEMRQLIGTPEYMSPEQADIGAVDIDTRADVYSLGVLLYELLTGTTPFDALDLRSKAYAEIQRVIREVDPPRPSTRLSAMHDTVASVAAQRNVEPARLRTLVRGELDWIVMKCLEKDRARRYETASALAQDVEHFLRDEPVIAGPASTAYRVQKFVRRYRGPVIASAAVLIVLNAGVIGTTVGLIGQSRQRRIAEQQRAEADRQRADAQKQEQQANRNLAIANAITRFLTDMLSSADPNRLLGDKVTVVQIMDAAVKELDAGKLKDQPRVEAFVRQTMGNTFRTLGRYDSAEPNFRKALELWRAVSPEEDTTISIGANDLAVLLQAQGRLLEAEPLYREALALNRKALPADHTEIASNLSNLAALLQDQDRLAEAEPLLREALKIRRKVLPPGDVNIAIVLNNLAFVLQVEGKLSEAEPLYREAVEILRGALPAGHPSIATTIMNFGLLLEDQGKLDAAEPLLREALESYRKSLPAGHPNIASAVTNVALLLQAQKKPAQAEPLIRQALAMRRAALPPAHPEIAVSLENLASVLADQGRVDETEALHREALAIRRKSLPADNPQIARSLVGLGLALTHQQRFSEAETALLEAEHILTTARAAPRRYVAQCYEALAALDAARDKSDPGKGYGERSMQWKAKIPATRPASKPATLPAN